MREPVLISMALCFGAGSRWPQLWFLMSRRRPVVASVAAWFHRAVLATFVLRPATLTLSAVAACAYAGLTVLELVKVQFDRIGRRVAYGSRL